ncbi:MAG: TolC family protein [Gemmatimonadaceae bacterium]
MLLAFGARAAASQVPAAHADSATLTLENAIVIARRNNPAFLKAQESLRTANEDIRSSRGALYPIATANLGGRYLESGQQVLGGLSFPLPSDVVATSFGIGLSYSLNASTLLAPKAAVAKREVVEADIGSAFDALRASVTLSYLAVLQAQATVAVEDTLLSVAKRQLNLVKARQAVGSDVQLDVKRAEVAYGQAQVAALTGNADVQSAMARLYEQIGISDTTAVTLTTKFAVSAPTYSLRDALREARLRNPDLRALSARERASEANVRIQRGRDSPTLTLQTEWGGQSFGYRNPSFLVAQAQGTLESQRSACFSTDSIRTIVGLPSTAAECNALPTVTEAAAQAIRHENGLPLRFVRSPWALTAQVSLPLFDDRNRERDLEATLVARDDARYDRRARDLKLTSEVTQAYLGVVTSAQAAKIEAQNLVNARGELGAAEDRYQTGVATFLDVAEARGSYAQASLACVTATYDYWRALAELERVVGRPLP